MRDRFRFVYPLIAVAIFASAVACSSSTQTASPIPANNGAQPIVGSNHPAEIVNQVLDYPCYTSQPCPIDFEIVFNGNQTPEIPTNEPMSVHENAFCPTSGSPGCDPTVTYNASNDTTTLGYAGSTVYHNRTSGQPGVHFGLLQAKNFTTNIKAFEAGSFWTYGSNPNVSEPLVSINAKGAPTASKNWKYAIVYVSVALTRGGASAYQTWNEIAYVPKGTGQPTFTFTNYGNQTVYVLSSGIIDGLSVPKDADCLKTPICTENLTLLGNLQEVNYPPPHASGSEFVNLTHPPTATLKPRAFPPPDAQ